MASDSLAGQIGDAWNAALLCVRATRQWLATAFSILTGVELAAASAPAEVAPMGVGFGLAPSWSFSAEYNHLSMGGNTLVDSRASTTASAVMGATNGSLLIKTSLQQAEP